jgi:hypothetical protein
MTALTHDQKSARIGSTFRHESMYSGLAEEERRLSVVEELEAAVSANLQRATRLRQSILQKAFTGELLTADNADDTDKK